MVVHSHNVFAPVIIVSCEFDVAQMSNILPINDNYEYIYDRRGLVGPHQDDDEERLPPHSDDMRRRRMGDKSWVSFKWFGSRRGK